MLQGGLLGPPPLLEERVISWKPSSKSTLIKTNKTNFKKFASRKIKEGQCYNKPFAQDPTPARSSRQGAREQLRRARPSPDRPEPTGLTRPDLSEPAPPQGPSNPNITLRPPSSSQSPHLPPRERVSFSPPTPPSSSSYCPSFSSSSSSSSPPCPRDSSSSSSSSSPSISSPSSRALQSSAYKYKQDKVMTNKPPQARPNQLRARAWTKH